MLICEHCGRLIEDYELKFDTECHGYTSLGQALEEKVPKSCSCGGSYVKAARCKICDNWFQNLDPYGVCDDCLEEYETVGEALKMGEDDLQVVDGINGFIAECLSVDMINKILIKWVEENFTDHSNPVVNYCEADKSYFAEWIADKYGD